MYSDLFDVLGGANAGGGRNRSGDDGKHIAASFKAGKMNMELQDSGKFMVTPDLRRGTIQLAWVDNSLKWEWIDRRDKSVVDSIAVEEGQGGTFERVETGKPEDRVYLWETKSKMRTMYWMQEKENDTDDLNVAQVNQFLANPGEANPNPANEPEAATSAGGDGSNQLDPDAMMQLMQGVNRPSSGAAGNQVDALSSILENLGMPQPGAGGSGTAGASAETGAASGAGPDGGAAAGGGTLTLADLQGAMQGLATATPPGTPAAGPPLQEVVTPGAVSSILENEEVCNRLMELLPENQRTRERLEENLRSPQVSQTLRSLTSALLPDEEGSIEGYHSVLANFQLDPNDGEAALRSGNPIQAFLDCVLASVEREKEETKQEESKEGGNEAMEE